MFRPWPKIPRWENETYRVTEKIDGTNACIIVAPGKMEGAASLMVTAQSRTRILSFDKDNYGFFAWVYDNQVELTKLGLGYHYGEWWGKGIQRGYGLKERRFSLFEPWRAHEIPGCCCVVPTIRHIVTGSQEHKLEDLPALLASFSHSVAAPGFYKPEGFVITSNLTGATYKMIKGE